MKITSLPIQGLILIEPEVFSDDRGYFFESFSEKKHREFVGNLRFVQDNISKSKRNSVRGLHYQVGEFAQGKICQAIVGKVLDVAVDLRFGSPSFGKHFAVELSEENHLQLWIPPGFAHGFSVLSEIAIFHYKCTALYSKDHERTLRFDDPALAIEWRVDNPIISPKDRAGVLLRNIDRDFVYQN